MRQHLTDSHAVPDPLPTVPSMTIYEIDMGPQMRANLKLVKPAPTPVNGTVPPKRARNADVRPREYLTPKEVERLIKAARAAGRRVGGATLGPG